jgi:hypothetical protein
MKRSLLVLTVACGLAAAASPVLAAPPGLGLVPDGTIGRQVLLVSAPGVPIGGTFSAQAIEAGFVPPPSQSLATRADRMDSVVLPGLEPRNKFADTVHWLLGVATLVAGGATGLTAGEGEDEGGGDGGGSGSLHHTLGYTTAGLAAATLLTGLWAHLGDIGVADGPSPQNIHALFGITGGLLMVATPFVADRGGDGDDAGSGHAVLGMTGELLMGIAVVWPLVF